MTTTGVNRERSTQFPAYTLYRGGVFSVYSARTPATRRTVVRTTIYAIRARVFVFVCVCARACVRACVCVTSERCFIYAQYHCTSQFTLYGVEYFYDFRDPVLCICARRRPVVSVFFRVRRDFRVFSISFRRATCKFTNLAVCRNRLTNRKSNGQTVQIAVTHYMFRRQRAE